MKCLIEIQYDSNAFYLYSTFPSQVFTECFAKKTNTQVASNPDEKNQKEGIRKKKQNFNEDK